MIQMPLAINIIQIIIQIFKQAEKVTENGLIAFQGLVVGFGEQIEIAEIGSYIKYALQSKDNECTKLACGIVSDLSTGMGERIGEYLDDFVPCLHEILRDQTLDRRIKLPALTALGDLCMYSGVAFNQKYLDTTLSIMNIAARASVNITGLDNDTLEFLSLLRETIIDQYIIILMAASESGFLAKYSPHLASIYDFSEATV